MPKRVLSDTMLTSPSLASVSIGAEALFPRLVLYADDFGCFDANPLVILGKVWPLRREVTPEAARAWLAELATAGMVLLWADGARWYGYLSGWHGPNGQRPRAEYDPSTKEGRKGSKRKTPVPPGAQDSAAVEIYAYTEKTKEIASREFPPFPAPAVAVPVAVADASTPHAPAASQRSLAEPPKSKAAKKPADPRHVPVRERLIAVFREVRGADYGYQGGKDARAVTALLALGPDAEIERRWKAALTAARFAGGCSSIAELPSRWNALVGATPAGKPPAIARMSTLEEFEKGGSPF